MAGYVASQALRLGSNIVLARLLFPAVFGQMTLVFVFIQGLQMFSDVGIGPAIIQNRRGDDEAFINTAWTIQCVRGGLLWVASCCIAWPVAAFYEQPILGWLIPVAGLNALFSGFESTSIHTQQRQLRRGRLTIVEIARQLIGLVVTVTLAAVDLRLYGPNDPKAVWAVIAGSLASTIAWVLLTHRYLPGVPNRFHLDKAAVRQLFAFGRWIFLSTLLTFLAVQSDRLIFGKMIPIATLGVYSIAATLAALPTEAVVKLGNSVIFPAYSRLVERQDFAGVFQRVRAPLLLGGGAIVSALLAGGPFVVGVLYDHRYADAGWILRFLTAAAWFRILEVTNSAALLATGRVRWVAAGNGAKVAGMVILIPLGFILGGFVGALAGVVGSELIKYLTAAWGAARGGLRGMGRDLLMTAAVAAVSLAAGAAGAFVTAWGAGKLVALAASVAVAGAPWSVAGLRSLRRERAASVLPGAQATTGG